MKYTAERLIAIAKNEIGYLEKQSNSQLDDKTANAGDKNWTKYARDLYEAGYYKKISKNGYAWCDMFVDWCFYILCNRDADKANEIICQTRTGSRAYGAGCTESRDYYKRDDRLFDSPKPGDQIFFSKDGKNAYHTGIVYKVDNEYVYTIEGNTSSEKGVVENGGAVRDKKYKLTYNRLFGFGRPKYDYSDLSNVDYDITVSDSNVSVSEPQSTTIPNPDIELLPKAFDLALNEISATKVVMQITKNYKTAFEWSYLLTNLINNSSQSKAIDRNSLNKLQIAGLVPNTPYLLKITAEDDYTSISQQIFFSTVQDFPQAVSNVTLVYSTTDSDSLLLGFLPPTNWGEYSKNRLKGYRLSLIINGSIVAHNDDLISYGGGAKVSTAFTLANLKKNVLINNNDTIQIGVQPWVVEETGKKLFSGSYPTASLPLLIKPCFNTIDAVHIKTPKGFKRAMLHNLTKK